MPTPEQNLTHAEAGTASSESFHAALSEVGQLLVRSLDPTVLYEAVIEVLQRRIGAQLVMVGELDRKAGPGMRDTGHGKKQKSPPADQLALFGSAPHPVVERLKTIDANAMTPLQALELVARLAEEARRG